MTMHHGLRRPGRHRAVLFSGLAALAVLGLSACRDTKPESGEKPAPASLEEVGEGEIGRITLTEDAAKRLDIQTAEVEAGASSALQIPFDAVIYQPDGTTWVYANPETLVFKREPVDVERIDGDVALVRSGPAAGTPVVIVGAAELWGFEFGIGK
jgi:hypothetical protein